MTEQAVIDFENETKAAFLMAVGRDVIVRVPRPSNPGPSFNFAVSLWLNTNYRGWMVEPSEYEFAFTPPWMRMRA